MVCCVLAIFFLEDVFGKWNLEMCQRTVTSLTFFVHDFDSQLLACGVDWDIDNLVPVGVEVVLPCHSACLLNTRKQNTGIRIGLAHGLDIAQVASIVEVDSHDTDWLDGSSKSTSTAFHGNWPPLKHHLGTTSLDACKVVPFLSLRAEVKHIIKLDLIRTNDRIRTKLAVILDDKSKFGSPTVSDQELLMGIRPDWVVGTLQLARDVDFS